MRVDQGGEVFHGLAVAPGGFGYLACVMAVEEAADGTGQADDQGEQRDGGAVHRHTPRPQPAATYTGSVRRRMRRG